MLQACGLKEPQKGAEISGISIDSRSLQPGDLFIALSGDPGPRFHSSHDSKLDGHNYIAQAIDKGASALMVSQDLKLDRPILKVKDTLDGLWDLGRFSRTRTNARVVAVTGSSGKTTARHFIEAMLRTQGDAHASTGSFNNHWGVPLSLALMQREAEFGVFEIGMNYPGEIAPLSEIVNPDVALVLNVLPVHLGFFESLDGIRKEKLSIVSGLRSSGTLVLPSDLDISDLKDLLATTNSKEPHCITFGMNADADVYPLAIETGEIWQVKAKVVDEEVAFQLKAGGEHRVATALASFAVLKSLGCDLSSAAGAVAEIEPPKGRGNRVRAGGMIVIDDSYNANPASMRLALQALAAEKVGRKIAILGEMLELGKDSDRFHGELAAYCDGIDGVITVGEQMGPLANKLREDKLLGSYEHIDQLDLSQFVRSLKKDDCVLVKGSNKVFWLHGFVSRLVEELN